MNLSSSSTIGEVGAGNGSSNPLVSVSDILSISIIRLSFRTVYQSGWASFHRFVLLLDVFACWRVSLSHYHGLVQETGCAIRDAVDGCGRHLGLECFIQSLLSIYYFGEWTSRSNEDWEIAPTIQKQNVEKASQFRIQWQIRRFIERDQTHSEVSD